jgi:pyruvate carboxylase subunit B
MTNPLKITDLTLRDGHQSLIATRMRTDEMKGIASEMNRVGFSMMEVWGGATFDVMIRYLDEDPWERLRILKPLLCDTPLRMLLRGQSLVGYRPYADDVVFAFVHHAARCGIDIFLVFDPLNDERNLVTAFEAIRGTGKQIQAQMLYALTGSRLGGEIYTIDYYVNKALAFQDLGVDSLCIEDMSGILNPYDADLLVRALKGCLRIPVELDCHFTSGMACMSYLKAIEAGVDAIGTCFAPLALRTSNPAIEPIVQTLRGTPRDCGIDLGRLIKIDHYLEGVISKYREMMDATRVAVIDPEVLDHQLPGGMVTNFVAQLKKENALNRLPEIYEEIPRVRKELGSPPLTTPVSQMVGAQAVQNVLFGRYKLISTQVKDYVFGLYGKPPGSIAPEIQELVLRRYRGEQRPVTDRPADLLQPVMEKAREETKNLARDIGDVLTYALYSNVGKEFLERKYGSEASAPA